MPRPRPNRPRMRAVRATCAAIAGGAALAALGTTATAQEDASWPVVGGDAAHARAADGPEPPYRTAWTSDVPARPIAGPVTGGGAVVVVGAATVVALDAETGEPRWQFDRVDGPAGPAAVAGDTVVYSSGSGSLAALVARSLADGEKRWTAFLGGPVVGGPAVVEGRIFMGTRAGSVVALDARTGETEWEFETEGPVDSSPAVEGDTVVAVTQRADAGTAIVLALDADSGDELWRFSPGQASIGSSSVAIAGGSAFLGMGDGRIRALSLEDGTEQWSAPALAGPQAFRPRQVPTAAGGALVPDVLALHHADPETGEERWTYRLSGPLQAASPTVVGSWTLIGDDTGEAAAIDLSSGRLVWRADVGDGPVAAPAVGDERVYLASKGENGRIVALEHDPAAALLDIPSPTALFPVRAVLNFGAAALVVGAAALILFRYLVRDGRPGGEES